MLERIKDLFKSLFSTFLVCLLLFCWLIFIGCLMTIFGSPSSVVYNIGMICIHAPFVLALIWGAFAWLSPDGEYGRSSPIHKPSRAKKKRNKDEESYLWDVYSDICEKCQYGEEIDKLTEKERVIYVTLELDGEVNNGGFDQYYSNSSGDFANEVIDALKALGAEKTLAICQRANAIFGDSVPKDRDERDMFLLEKITPEQKDILEECDEQFFITCNEISELGYRYLKEYEKEKPEEEWL